MLGGCGGDSKPKTLPSVSAQGATLQGADQLTLDGSGNLYVSDFFGGRIYRIRSGQSLLLVAGNGTSTTSGGLKGNGGRATEAEIDGPAGLAFDAKGDLYVVDHVNNRVRKIDTSGVITTAIGSGPVGANMGSYAGDGGQAVHARLQEPIGLVIDSRGNLLIADRDNDRIRKVAANGVITTLAGNGDRGFSGDGGPAPRASLDQPETMVIDKEGNLYVAVDGSERVRRIDTRGVITTIAGNGKAASSGDSGPAVRAGLHTPYGLALDKRGNLYVSELEGCRVRKIDLRGVIATVAGRGKCEFSGDGGPATAAGLAQPAGLAVDTDGSLYIVDGVRVRKVDSNGVITTVAGGSG
jgi:trimeric autotransporter adhesin